MSLQNPPIISFYSKYLSCRIRKRERKQDKLIKKGKQPTEKFVAYTNFLKNKLELENERIAIKKKK